MRAGLLTKVITILSPETTINEFGEQVQEYKFKYKTRARVLHDNGSRDIVNGEIFYPYRKSFDVRSYVPVTEFDIIEFEGHQYRIITIDNRIEHTNDKVIVAELINN